MNNLQQIVTINGWKEYSMQTPHERKNTLLDTAGDKKKERQPKSSRLPHPKAQNRRRAACTSWLFRDLARLTTHAAMQFARLTYQERTSKEFYM